MLNAAWFDKFGVLMVAVAICLFSGCEGAKAPAESEGEEAAEESCCAGEKEECPSKQKGSDEEGDVTKKAVEFKVAWCTNEDPKVAAETAVKDAMAKLGGDAKGLIFYGYYPKKVTGDDGEEKEVPDATKDAQVYGPIAEAAGDIPVIGCRARSLVTGGTMLENTVAVMAIGGEGVHCKAAVASLQDDRMAVGKSIGEQLADVKDLKLVFALSEMSLSFETKEGVSVEDFIRGVNETAGKDVVLFGGNGMPNDYPADKGGVQFLGDEMLEGSVVAMGIGGPIAVHANHTNEFDLSEETVTVTEAKDKWIIKMDDKPAAEVYRKLRGMTDDEQFTNDSEHPIGVCVGEDKVYLRMILDWIDAEGKDVEGNPSDLPPGSLKFVAAVPEQTKIKILIGGGDAKKIISSAGEGISESLAKAGEADPLLVLLSDCCARGFRLRGLREGDECEIKGAILPAMGEDADYPIFGFYAWGELGPIAGPFAGLNCMYQQHTFVSAVVTEEK